MASDDRDETDGTEAILDAGVVASVGFVVDDGPVVVPVGYGRDGDRLLVRGSIDRRLKAGAAVGGGIPVCVNVTVVDGRGPGYRTVVAFGRARTVDQGLEVSLDEMSVETGPVTSDQRQALQADSGWDIGFKQGFPPYKASPT